MSTPTPSDPVSVWFDRKAGQLMSDLGSQDNSCRAPACTAATSPDRYQCVVLDRVPGPRLLFGRELMSELDDEAGIYLETHAKQLGPDLISITVDHVGADAHPGSWRYRLLPMRWTTDAAGGAPVRGWRCGPAICCRRQPADVADLDVLDSLQQQVPCGVEVLAPCASAAAASPERISSNAGRTASASRSPPSTPGGVLEEECGVPHGDLMQHARDDAQRRVAGQLHHPEDETLRSVSASRPGCQPVGMSSTSILPSSSKASGVGFGEQPAGHRLDARPGHHEVGNGGAGQLEQQSRRAGNDFRAGHPHPGTGARAAAHLDKPLGLNTRTASRRVGRLTPSGSSVRPR